MLNKETGQVVDYNGFEGRIENTNGTYCLLRENISRENREDVTVGTIVEFIPVIYTNNFTSFSVAKSVTIKSKNNISVPTRTRHRNK